MGARRAAHEARAHERPFQQLVNAEGAFCQPGKMDMGKQQRGNSGNRPDSHFERAMERRLEAERGAAAARACAEAEEEPVRSLAIPGGPAVTEQEPVRSLAIPARATAPRPISGGAEAQRAFRIAGIDEAGRGPLAGPVVAAAVIWPRGARAPRGLNDSKQVSPERRAELFEEIRVRAGAAAIGLATAREIDAINILEATRLAARRAIDALPAPPDALLTDALALPGCAIPLEAIVKGDCKSISIAAASILAKVARDRLMELYALEYPGYGWEHNRGYPTADHYAAIEREGPSTLHRLSFSGIGFFTQRLRPSQTFLRLWGRRAAPDAPDAPDAQIAEEARARWENHRKRIVAAKPARAWRLAPAPELPWFLLAAAADHCAEAILANSSMNVSGVSGEAGILCDFLPECEIEALRRSRKDPHLTPDWLEL